MSFDLSLFERFTVSDAIPPYQLWWVTSRGIFKMTNIGEKVTPEQLNNWFTYHAPTETDLAAYKILRDAGKRFAEQIIALTPESADQTAAIRKVREAVMTANAAIACKGK